MKKRNIILAATAIALVFFNPSLAQAQRELLRNRIAVDVPLNKSEIIDLDVSASRISVGNASVADILMLRPRQLYIVGKKLGSTNVVLWNNQDQVVNTINVDVTHDLESLKAKLHELLPDEQVDVYSAHGSIVMSGEVSSPAKVAMASDLARSFVVRQENNQDAGARVLNMLQVGGAQQVMLEVQVAEISRTLMRRLGIRFHAIGEGSNISFGAVSGGGRLLSGSLSTLDIPIPGEGINVPRGSTEFLPNPLNIDNYGLFGSFMDGTTLMNLVLDAAQENGLAKILAEPTLTTMTGQEATFHAGGEFPIPVPGGTNQATTIQFKDFGIGLGFIPVVLDSGMINLKVSIRVSELSNRNAVTIAVPQTNAAFLINSLSTRSANSTIELQNGQTMGIAGLIDESLREQVNKFPGLGDLPIIGSLFRSQEYVKGQTELVILVTPHFAKANPRSAYKLPTDSFVDPDAIDFYLLGRMEGPQRETTGTTTPQKGGAEGTFGHQL